MSHGTGAQAGRQPVNGEINPIDAVAGAFPIGAYDEDLVVAAGRTLAEVARYLNHATQPATTGLSSTAGLSRLAGALLATVQRLPQLLEQLSGLVRGAAEYDGLAVDGLGPVPVGGPAEVALVAAEELTVAASWIGYGGSSVRRASRAMSRLYVVDAGGGGGDG